MMVMLSTTMGFGELRHIRRRDVDLKKRSLLVRDGAKNFYRDRTIPMNATALESMMGILERWEGLGGRDESEFILPHRPRTLKGPWIFTEPMSAITTAFNGIRKEAGLPKFRVYDCRVQAITKLLSNPAVSPQV
jgi:integrase